MKTMRSVRLISLFLTMAIALMVGASAYDSDPNSPTFQDDVNVQSIEVPIIIAEEDASEFPSSDSYAMVASDSDYGTVWVSMSRASSSSTSCTLYMRYVSSPSYAASALKYDSLTIKNSNALDGTVYYSYNKYPIYLEFGAVSSLYTVSAGTYSIPTNVSSVTVQTVNMQAYINSLGTWMSMAGNSSLVNIN